jgi:hypothetical protein
VRRQNDGDRAKAQAERRSHAPESNEIGCDAGRRSKESGVRGPGDGESQIVPGDERSSESCVHCEINGLAQEHVEGHEKLDLVALAANLEEARTWYYVVDCATCKAAIPFKHAPEDEPILPFPMMRVRCLHCHADHTYAPDLISHRKAAAPSEIVKADRPSSDAGDGDREASRDRQEDRGIGDSGGRVILDREIDPISSSMRRDNIVIAAAVKKRATIFFLSSCLLAAGWVSQLAMDIFYPVPLAALNELRSSGPAMLLSTAYFGVVSLGLVLFIFGIGSFFVEVCGFKRKVDEFVLRIVSSRLVVGRIIVPRTGVLEKTGATEED